jgi:hypothetical protein
MQKCRIFACLGYEGNISNEYTSKDPRIYEIIKFLKIWETEIHGCEFGWTELFDTNRGATRLETFGRSRKTFLLQTHHTSSKGETDDELLEHSWGRDTLGSDINT